MAEIREVAIGIATVLKSTTSPEPFPVTLKNQSLADAALLVRSIVRECTDAGVPLHMVKVGTELLQHMLDGHLPESSYLGVRVAGDAELGTELLFYRMRPAEK